MTRNSYNYYRQTDQVERNVTKKEKQKNGNKKKTKKIYILLKLGSARWEDTPQSRDEETANVEDSSSTTQTREREGTGGGTHARPTLPLMASSWRPRRREEWRRGQCLGLPLPFPRVTLASVSLSISSSSLGPHLIFVSFLVLKCSFSFKLRSVWKSFVTFWFWFTSCLF